MNSIFPLFLFDFIKKRRKSYTLLLSKFQGGNGIEFLLFLFSSSSRLGRRRNLLFFSFFPSSHYEKRNEFYSVFSFLFFFTSESGENWERNHPPFSSLSSSFFFFQNSNGEMGISSSPSSLFPKIKKGIKMKRRRENLHFFLSFLFQISRKKRNRISSFFFSSYLLAER